MSALAKGKVHWGWERLVDFNTSTNNSPKMTIFPIPFKEGKYDYIEINYIRKIMLSKNIPSYAILFSQFSKTHTHRQTDISLHLHVHTHYKTPESTAHALQSLPSALGKTEIHFR